MTTTNARTRFAWLAFLLAWATTGCASDSVEAPVVSGRSAEVMDGDCRSPLDEASAAPFAGTWTLVDADNHAYDLILLPDGTGQAISPDGLPWDKCPNPDRDEGADQPVWAATPPAGGCQELTEGVVGRWAPDACGGVAFVSEGWGRDRLHASATRPLHIEHAAWRGEGTFEGEEDEPHWQGRAVRLPDAAAEWVGIYWLYHADESERFAVLLQSSGRAFANSTRQWDASADRVQGMWWPAEGAARLVWSDGYRNELRRVGDGIEFSSWPPGALESAGEAEGESQDPRWDPRNVTPGKLGLTAVEIVKAP